MTKHWMVEIVETYLFLHLQRLVGIDKNSNLSKRKKYDGLYPISFQCLFHFVTLMLKDVLRRYNTCEFSSVCQRIKAL